MKPAVLLAFLLLPVAGGGAQPSLAGPAPPPGSTAAKIKQQLDKTIIPSFKAVNATLPEAVALIMKEAKAADPKSKPVPIEIDPDLLKTPEIPPPRPDMPGRTITLTVTNISESELLHYVLGLAGTLNYRFTKTGIEIEGCKADASQTLITRRYPSPGVLFDAKITDDAKCKAVLEDAGIMFPNESSAHYDVKAKVLTVRNTEPNLYLIDQIVDASRRNFGRSR